ncbi:MAG TPA: cupin domain-containing protein [Burkholderiales bacterium]|nr:cupin domain-containing protein [Burkholderiales bacterium]
MSNVFQLNPGLAQFSHDISVHNLAPLWERTVRMQPGSPCAPALWRYADTRPLLARAAALITAQAAERRVLVLENPALRGSFQITQSLFAGLQIILPGEIAPSHRHTPNALRFIIEGEGAYTAVDGQRTPMSPGDFVVTPNWAWHDHGNVGDGPVVWLDGLDTPFAQFFGAMFRENHPQQSQPLTQTADNAQMPPLRYPYARTREALAQLTKTSAPNGTHSTYNAHGVKLRYTNPATGGNVFPTIAAFMQLLPQGFDGRSYRCTDGAVYCVVEGHGAIYFADERREFEAHDCFVIPPWQWHRFTAQSECVLFSFSDRAAQEALGFWREVME